MEQATVSFLRQNFILYEDRPRRETSLFNFKPVFLY